MSAVPSQAFEPTHPLQVRYQFDRGPGRWRIGLVVLSTDLATERDFRNMAPGDDLQFSVSRIEQVNPVTVENLRRMAPSLTAAAALVPAGAKLDALAYSCTSGTVAIGYDAIAASVHAAHPGVPVVTPITSALAAFEVMGICRIALLTPYVDSVNQAMRGFLQAHGIEVRSMHSFLLEDDRDMARLPPAAIHQGVLEANRATPDADAVFVSCTALRSVDIVDAAEHDIGKPVLSAIQTLFWQSMRAAGCPLPVAGYGRLLREH